MSVVIRALNAVIRPVLFNSAAAKICGLPSVRACARGAIPIGIPVNHWGQSIVDLLEGFVGLVAFIAFLACLGKVGDTLSALEKRERGH